VNRRPRGLDPGEALRTLERIAPLGSMLDA
jgi:hypothetical protein